MSQKRKSIRKAQKGQTSPKKGKTSMRQKMIIIGVVILSLLFAASMFFSTPNGINSNAGNSSKKPVPTSNSKSAEPQFVKEGALQFFRDGNISVAIDIEVADTPKEIEQGLMYRQKMDNNKGMLFILPDVKIQGFWMKNTLIPLDIIYVDTAKMIVSIQKNTVPLSRESLPSEGPAKFVIEVNAGFTDTHSLFPGDKVDFQIN